MPPNFLYSQDIQDPELQKAPQHAKREAVNGHHQSCHIRSWRVDVKGPQIMICQKSHPATLMW